MSTGPAITFEALPASYGDALLVTCPVPGGAWRLLVDSGPSVSWPKVRQRLTKLPTAADGTRYIDLAIVSHIDHDHIGAVPRWFDDAKLALRFGDIWFNGWRHLGAVPRAVGEGEALAALLGAADRELPWNRAFGGEAVCICGDGGFVEIPGPPDHPRLTLLSPTPKQLAKLATVWDAALEQLHRGEANTESEPTGGARALELSRGKETLDLDALAAHPSTMDRTPPNGSSIALLLEHRGASLVLAADAFPNVLASALRTLAKHRRVQSLQVDLFKLSHHGSRGNLVSELLGVVQAKHYAVSTDNTHFGHPDDETLARVVLHGGPQPALCFNYATARNLRWADPELQQRYGFTTLYPLAAAAGTVLPLQGSP